MTTLLVSKNEIVLRLYVVAKNELFATINVVVNESSLITTIVDTGWSSEIVEKPWSCEKRERHNFRER